MNKATATRTATPTNSYELDSSSTKVTLHTTLFTVGLLLSLVACSPQPSREDLKQTAASPTTSVGSQVKACVPAQLAISLDSGNGRFNGMSHSGTMLVVRNIGTSNCALPTQPAVALTDTNKQALDITARNLPESGSTSTAPITLVPGATASSDLRWVSNDVYDNGHGKFPAYLTLELGGKTLSTTFVGHLWGAAGKPPTFTQTLFKPVEISATPTTAKSIDYTCTDGRTVHAMYPDTDSAVITLDGQTHRLHTAISASGARYVGDQWQWWTKGMHNAQLAPLKSGEKIASASGVACSAP
ncbi:MAG: MliC family protein [Rhodanobacter sp.]